MARRTRLWDLIAIFVASVRPSLFLASPAAAHPHVWVTVHSEILLNPDRQITGIRHAWTFDEFYSTMAVQGLNTNGDGVLSADELKPLEEANIKPLKDFDYFTFVHPRYITLGCSRALRLNGRETTGSGSLLSRRRKTRPKF